MNAGGMIGPTQCEVGWNVQETGAIARLVSSGLAESVGGLGGQ